MGTAVSSVGIQCFWVNKHLPGWCRKENGQLEADLRLIWGHFWLCKVCSSSWWVGRWGGTRGLDVLAPAALVLLHFFPIGLASFSDLGWEDPVHLPERCQVDDPIGNPINCKRHVFNWCPLTESGMCHQWCHQAGLVIWCTLYISGTCIWIQKSRAHPSLQRPFIMDSKFWDEGCFQAETASP